jgi:hypothetical protein
MPKSVSGSLADGLGGKRKAASRFRIKADVAKPPAQAWELPPPPRSAEFPQTDDRQTTKDHH